jgi:hypothetical protein
MCTPSPMQKESVSWRSARWSAALDAVAVVLQQAQEARVVAFDMVVSCMASCICRRRAKKLHAAAASTSLLPRAGNTAKSGSNRSQRRAPARGSRETAVRSPRGCRICRMVVQLVHVRLSPVRSSRPDTRCTALRARRPKRRPARAFKAAIVGQQSSTTLSARPTANDSPLMKTCLPRYSICVLRDSDRPRFRGRFAEAAHRQRLGRTGEEHIVLRLGHVLAKEDGDVFLVKRTLFSSSVMLGEHVARDFGRLAGRFRSGSA